MSKKNEKPTLRNKPLTAKIPHANQVCPQKIPRFDLMERSKYPSWQFGLIDLCGPQGCSWNAATIEEITQLFLKLKTFESLTWGEIINNFRKDHHYMPRNAICNDAQKRLEEISQDDIDELFSFHLGSAKRLWGIIDGHEFKILWWDPKHQIYPMNIKDN